MTTETLTDPTVITAPSPTGETHLKTCSTAKSPENKLHIRVEFSDSIKLRLGHSNSTNEDIHSLLNMDASRRIVIRSNNQLIVPISAVHALALYFLKVVRSSLENSNATINILIILPGWEKLNNHEMQRLFESVKIVNSVLRINFKCNSDVEMMVPNSIGKNLSVHENHKISSAVQILLQNTKLEDLITIPTKECNPQTSNSKPLSDVDPEVLKCVELSLAKSVEKSLKVHKQLMYEVTDKRKAFTDAQLKKYHEENLDLVLQSFSATYDQPLLGAYTNVTASILETRVKIQTKIDLQFLSYLKRHEVSITALMNKIKHWILEEESAYDEDMEKFNPEKRTNEEIAGKHKELSDKALLQFRQKFATNKVDWQDFWEIELRTLLKEKLEELLHDSENQIHTPAASSSPKPMNPGIIRIRNSSSSDSPIGNSVLKAPPNSISNFGPSVGFNGFSNAEANYLQNQDNYQDSITDYSKKLLDNSSPKYILPSIARLRNISITSTDGVLRAPPNSVSNTSERFTDGFSNFEESYLQEEANYRSADDDNDTEIGTPESYDYSISNIENAIEDQFILNDLDSAAVVEGKVVKPDMQIKMPANFVDEDSVFSNSEDDSPNFEGNDSAVPNVKDAEVSNFQGDDSATSDFQGDDSAISDFHGDDSVISTSNGDDSTARLTLLTRLTLLFEDDDSVSLNDENSDSAIVNEEDTEDSTNKDSNSETESMDDMESEEDIAVEEFEQERDHVPLGNSTPEIKEDTFEEIINTMDSNTSDEKLDGNNFTEEIPSADLTDKIDVSVPDSSQTDEIADEEAALILSDEAADDKAQEILNGVQKVHDIPVVIVTEPEDLELDDEIPEDIPAEDQQATEAPAVSPLDENHDAEEMPAMILNPDQEFTSYNGEISESPEISDNNFHEADENSFNSTHSYTNKSMEPEDIEDSSFEVIEEEVSLSYEHLPDISSASYDDGSLAKMKSFGYTESTQSLPDNITERDSIHHVTTRKRRKSNSKSKRVIYESTLNIHKL